MLGTESMATRAVWPEALGQLEVPKGAFDWASSRLGRLCEGEKSIRTVLQFAWQSVLPY